MELSSFHGNRLKMRRSTLGRGLDALIHAVPDRQSPTHSAPDLSTPLQWPVEHSYALTSVPLRLAARQALEKLSTRPRTGLKAARLYLDHLRQIDGRTSIDTSTTGIDLTSATMLQLTHGHTFNLKRYSFFGVSIWLR